jgi:hypothetical protein
MNSISGTLAAPHASDSGVLEWKIEVVQLFKAGRVHDARKLLCASARPEEMEEIFRWMYDNLDLWSADPEKQDQAIVIIRNGYVNIPLVADQEINLAATLIELSHL